MNQFRLYKTVSMFRGFCIHQCQRMCCCLAIHSCECEKLVTLYDKYTLSYNMKLKIHRMERKFLPDSKMLRPFHLYRFAWKLNQMAIHFFECLFFSRPFYYPTFNVFFFLISKRKWNQMKTDQLEQFRSNLPLSTVTIKASWCINAYVMATPVGNFTFIHQAFILRFVLASRTIDSSITNFTIWYAHSTATIELCSSVATLHW